MSNESLNHGMYADQNVADSWVSWTKSFHVEDVRNIDVYPYLNAWVKKNQPKTILEIGSGSGLCTSKVDFGSATYIGIEPSAPLRKIARDTYPGRDFRPGIAEKIPLKDCSIDAVYSVFMLLHVENLDAAARELNRVLVPGGHFVIVTANPASYDLWKTWHTNIQIKGKELRGDMKYLPNHQMFLHSIDEVRASLEQNGLKITDTLECGRQGTLETPEGPHFCIIVAGFSLK